VEKPKKEIKIKVENKKKTIKNKNDFQITIKNNIKKTQE
jgi:hypothetical protein